MRLEKLAIILTALVLSSCSQEPTSHNSKLDPKYDLSPAKDSCKNFPVAIYPNVTSKICEKNPQYENTPISYTAYVESKDPVSKVTKFYKTEIKKSGWRVEPVKVESATHAVVTIKKGVAYASITINSGKNKKGSSFQIQAYPFGN